MIERCTKKKKMENRKYSYIKIWLKDVRKRRKWRTRNITISKYFYLISNKYSQNYVLKKFCRFLDISSIRVKTYCKTSKINNSQLWLFDLTEFTVWNIKGLRSQRSKTFVLWIPRNLYPVELIPRESIKSFRKSLGGLTRKDI